MAFDKVVPIWNAAGVEPPESLKNSGFTANYKPPADFFNWFWHNVSQCLAELQGMTPADIGAEVALYMGENPITGAANDTYAQWLAKGTGYGFYNTANQLNKQPSDQGYLLNIAQSRGVAQIWFEIPGGKMFHRVGNTSGLTAWSEVPDGATVTAAIKATRDAADKAQTTADSNAKRLTSLETYEQRPFEHVGDFVQLENFEGMPMNCVTHIEPIQQGSGDPYPPGGSKNLTPFAINGNAFSDAGISGTFDDNGIVINGTPSIDYAKLVNEIIDLPVGTYYVSGGEQSRVYLQVSTSHADGSTKHYNNQAFEITGAETKVQIMIQTGVMATAGTLSNYRIYPMLVSGNVAPAHAEYVPYSNIRPISGRTGAELTRSGKNLCGGANDIIVQNNPSATTVTYADNVFTLFTRDGYADGFVFGHGAFKKGRKYTISGTAAGYVNLRIYNKSDLTTILHQVTADADGGFSHTFEAPTDDVVFRVWVNYSTTCTLTDFQIEEGDRSEYEPYKGETFAADFGQTVYGGQIDWNKGMLTLDSALVTIDGNSNVVKSGKDTESIFYIACHDMAKLSDYKNALVCNTFSAVARQRDLYDGSVGVTGYYSESSPYPGQNWLYFSDGVHCTVADMKAWLAENPIQVCYKVADPVTIQLTPQQILALQGMNNMWSDAGETTVSGRTDILWLTSYLMKQNVELKATIEALQSNVEALETAVTTE